MHLTQEGGEVTEHPTTPWEALTPPANPTIVFFITTLTGLQCHRLLPLHHPHLCCHQERPLLSSHCFYPRCHSIPRATLSPSISCSHSPHPHGPPIPIAHVNSPFPLSPPPISTFPYHPYPHCSPCPHGLQCPNYVPTVTSSPLYPQRPHHPLCIPTDTPVPYVPTSPLLPMSPLSPHPHHGPNIPITTKIPIKSPSSPKPPLRPQRPPAAPPPLMTSLRTTPGRAAHAQSEARWPCPQAGGRAGGVRRGRGSIRVPPRQRQSGGRARGEAVSAGRDGAEGCGFLGTPRRYGVPFCAALCVFPMGRALSPRAGIPPSRCTALWGTDLLAAPLWGRDLFPAPL